MAFRSPIDALFTPLKYDKFGVTRPPSVTGGVQYGPHSGVDLRPHENGGSRNVYAIEDGIIKINTPKNGAYYQIDHGNGWNANYVHVTNRPLPVNTWVRKGQLIGNYNLFTHLHFTLLKDGQLVDPEHFIAFNQNTMPRIKELEKQVQDQRATIENRQNQLIKAINTEYPDDKFKFNGRLRGLVYNGDYETLFYETVNNTVNYSPKIRSYEAELDDLEAEHKALASQNINLKEQVHDLENKIYDLKLANQSLQNKLNQKPNSSNKGFFESKKIGSLIVSFIAAAPAFTPLIPDSVRSQWITLIGVIESFYLTGQSAVDAQNVKKDNQIDSNLQNKE